jgi:mitochondrial translocator assembly and maintenance protein 41
MNQNPYNGQLTNDSDLIDLLQEHFPPLRHAFGYGSGVFEQKSMHDKDDISDSESKMIDVILVTDDAFGFHKELLKRHRHHYSPTCRLAGPSFCSHLQNNFGAKLFFHPYVKVEDKIIKYGVIETKYILDDLRNWSHLYTAGRMHKPTLPIISDQEVTFAQLSSNLPFALATALLLLEESMQTKESRANLSSVFESIAQISYSGDPRMEVGGEDPRKVQKLVHGNSGQIDRFRSLYQPVFDDFMRKGLLSLHVQKNDNTTIVEWDNHGLRQVLPLRFAGRTHILPSIRKIVRDAARAQSLKGIVTAGIFKSVKYATAKFSKGLIMR